MGHCGVVIVLMFIVWITRTEAVSYHCASTNCAFLSQDSTDDLDWTDAMEPWDHSYTAESLCYYRGHRGSYIGTVNVTKTGRVCQSWAVKQPHKHHFTASSLPDTTATHNYCRIVDETTPWCYTMNPQKRYELCDVRECGGMKSKAPSSSAANARLISQALDQGQFEITFIYKASNAFAYVQLYKKCDDELVVLGDELKQTQWTLENSTFECRKPCQIVIEARHSYNGQGSTVYVGDVNVTEKERDVPNPHVHRMYSGSSNTDKRYCNFDADNCSVHWSYDVTGGIGWEHRSGGGGTDGTGPLAGYGGNGSYLLMDASHHRSGEKARLVSDVITPANVNLTFWYSMYGYDVGALRVFKTSGSDRAMVWEREGDQRTRDWLRGVVDMSCVRACVVTIEAEKGVFEHGDIGVDEVTVVVRHDLGRDLSQTTQLREFCDFETDDCGWTQTPDASVVWQVWSGASPKSNTGPVGDYTTGSGHYALFQDSTSRANRSAVLTSHVIRRPFWRTLNMAYHMLQYNNQTSRLSVYTSHVATGVRSLVWNKPPAEGVWKWQTDSVTVTSDQPYVIEIEAVGGAGGYGDIGVDNLDVSSGMLPAVANCDFVYGFCNWTQRKDDDFDWLLNYGETPTKRTGPKGASHYAYAESSFPRVSGHVAVVESPTIGPLGNQSICVRFLYNMYGAQVGKLELKRVTSGGSGGKVLWGKSGNQGQKWWPGHVTVLFTDDDEFRFQFRATRKYGLRGDIAIRDVKAEMNACKEDAPYNCDFEGDTCEWRPATSDGSGNWSFSLETANNDSDATPPADHTTGSPHGGYMYVTTSTAPATIQTTVTTTRVLCVEFWYFSYGNDRTGKLDFWTRPNDGSMATIKWSFVHETVTWQRAKITVQSNLEYTMGFGAKAADGFAAIDDITVAYGSCD